MLLIFSFSSVKSILLTYFQILKKKFRPTNIIKGLSERLLA